MVSKKHQAVGVLGLALYFLVGGPQEAAGQVDGVGLKAGWNITTLTGEMAEAANVESINGLLAGGFVRFEIAKGFSLQPELLFSRKGAEGDTLGIRGTVTLNYIEIPVLLRYTIPVDFSYVPTVFAGPAFSGRLSANAEATVWGRAFTTSITDEVKSSDTGIVLGFEIAFPGNPRRITFEGRFTQGLKEIDQGGDLKVKNRVFSIVMGIYFGIKQSEEL